MRYIPGALRLGYKPYPNETQIVAVESLAVKNLLQNHHMAKAIADVGWGELIRQLSYKVAWYGRTQVKIDRFFPFSKTCSGWGGGRRISPARNPILDLLIVWHKP
ncbi:MAG TPA: transposase [Chloroflexia bacterium]|nr:transposase [Chloroflexia bacterium]